MVVKYMAYLIYINKQTKLDYNEYKEINNICICDTYN